MGIKSLGGAEAEGFGVGGGHEEPTPALRATPPERGFKGKHQDGCKIQVLKIAQSDAKAETANARVCPASCGAGAISG